MDKAVENGWLDGDVTVLAIMRVIFEMFFPCLTTGGEDLVSGKVYFFLQKWDVQFHTYSCNVEHQMRFVVLSGFSQ